MSRFTIIHPSRGRPDMAFATYQKWVNSASSEIQYILSLDNDDSKLGQYKLLFTDVEIITGDNKNLIDAVQCAVPNIKNDIVIVVSDDFDCPDGWDTILDDCIPKGVPHPGYAIYVNDGYSYGKNVMTIPILSKALIERLGYIYYPKYSGMFADNDLYEVCDELKCLIYCDQQYIFQHNHYTNGKAQLDATYKRHNHKQGWEYGQDLLSKRRAINFGLDGPKLSILIATIDERKADFDTLFQNFEEMRQRSGYGDCVEIKPLSDDRQLSIGEKRQRLLEMAKGKWIVFFDDDDWPYHTYIDLIMEAIIKNPDIDCIGINGVMTTNGKNAKRWCHRLGHPIAEGFQARQKGFDYLRPIIHFNPVKKDKALLAGFKDMKFGEDFDYASRLNPTLTKEFYIKEPLFHYRFIPKVYE